MKAPRRDAKKRPVFIAATLEYVNKKRRANGERIAIVGLHRYAEKRKLAIKYQGGDSLSLADLTEKYIANSAKRVAKL